MQEQKEVLELSGVNVGFARPGFWDELEKGQEKIKTYSPTDDYGSFNESYLQILECVKNLPSFDNIEIGSVVTGKIHQVRRDVMIVDCDYKDYIYVDLKSADYKVVENLEVGEAIDVMITDIIDNPFRIKGSVSELIKAKVHTKLNSAFHAETELICKITEVIPAGFMLFIEMDNINIPAFMPNTLAGVNRLTVDQTSKMLGQRIEVMLETLQQEKGYYVVSRKKYLQSTIKAEIAKLEILNTKKTDNKIYTGHVTGTKDFGVFVEFNGCLTGMIHKMNVNSVWTNRITEIPAGSPIDFYVKDVVNGKLILTQIIRETLWDVAEVGLIIDGTIKSIKPFGLMVQLDDETIGLVPASTLKNRTFNEGDKIRVHIIDLKPEERKMYLGICDGTENIKKA